MKKTALFVACAGLMIGGIALAAPQPATAGVNVSFGGRGYLGAGYSGYGYGNPGYGYGNPGYGYGNPGYGYGTPGIGYGSPGLGYGVNQGFNNYGGGFGYGNNCYGGFGGGHYDYHGPSLVPHGNHLDAIPGHYDYHYGGHHH